jgi:hypothetical protein
MNEQQIDPALAQKAQEIENDGKRRFGDAWPTYIDAVTRVLPKGTDPAAVIRSVASTDDPAGAFAKAGRESLLALAGSDNPQIAREAEATYQKIRNEERDAFRKARGRR